MRALALVPALAGCNLVFGVDHDVPADAPVVPDASPTEVRGTLAHRFVHNDASGAPIAEAAPLVEAQHCPAAFAGDTALDVACDAGAGTFGFALSADTRYRLVSGIDDYETASRTPDLTFVEWGRPDQQPSSAEQTLRINLVDASNLGVTGPFFYASSGVWAGPVSTTATVGYVDVPWTSPLLDANKGDLLYAYRDRTPNMSRPSYIITGDRGQVSVTMASGAMTMAHIQLAQLPTDRCVHVAIDVPHEQARLATLFPELPPWRRGYYVYSAASLANGTGGLDYLARDVVDLSAGQEEPPLFDELDRYPAAIAGRDTLLLRIVDRYDRMSFAYAGVQAFDRLASTMCSDPTTCCEEPPAFPDAAIPSGLRLSDVALNDVDQIIGLGPDESPIARWTLSEGPAVDRVVVALLRRDEPPALTVVHRWFLPPDQDHITIDRALLAPGTYLLQISADRGFPGVAGGQLGAPFTYPWVLAIARSQPFKIGE